MGKSRKRSTPESPISEKKRKHGHNDFSPLRVDDSSESDAIPEEEPEVTSADKYKPFKISGYSRKYDENCKKDEYIVFLSHKEDNTPFSDKDRINISAGLRKHCVAGVTYLKPLNKFKIGIIFELPNNANVFLQNSKMLDELSLKATVPASDTEITGVITSVPTEMSNKKIFKLIDSCRNVIQVRRFMRRERGLNGAVAYLPTQTVAITFASTQPPEYVNLDHWRHEEENSRPSIPSFSLSLDSILGSHGLSLCSLTEVLGLPGTGKTQLCLQLCASIQIPRVLGGLSSEALYIDTNTNFAIDRFEDIFSSSMLHCMRCIGLPFPLKIENRMSKLHYVNAFGLETFCAFMHTLPKFVEEYSQVKLIVVDSIAFPFKEGISPKKRTGLLFRLLAELQKLATEKQIAVVLTNEMSTRGGLSGGSIVGALGDAWAHRCNARILLAEVDGTRHAVRMKSSTLPTAVATFQVTSDGIRDVE